MDRKGRRRRDKEEENEEEDADDDSDNNDDEKKKQGEVNEILGKEDDGLIPRYDYSNTRLTTPNKVIDTCLKE